MKIPSIPVVKLPLVDVSTDPLDLLVAGLALRMKQLARTSPKFVELIHERHRHRFEFNNEYKAEFEANGMICSGINPETNLVEIIELPQNKWFIGVQFHPEYSSTVLNPHPLFINFVKKIYEKS